MNILVDSLAALGLLAPAAGIAAAAVRHRHRSLLQRGLKLKNHGRYGLSERALAEASKPVPLLGLMESNPVVLQARLQLCWLWMQENKFDAAAEALHRLKPMADANAACERLAVEIRDASAWLYLQTERPEFAYSLLNEGLALCSASPDAFQHSLPYASLLCTSAWYHICKNDYVAAATSLRQSQATLMAAVGAQSIHHLPVLMNIAWVEAHSGATGEANRTLAHALKTYGPILGRWHPRNAHVIALLGCVAALENDWKSANEYLSVAAKILKAHGLMHTLQGQKIEQALKFLSRY